MPLFRPGSFLLALLWLPFTGCGEATFDVSLATNASGQFERSVATTPVASASAVVGPAAPSVGTDLRELLQINPEKPSLRLGFIKLTDCAPLVIAREKGFFTDEGLQVEVIAQPNWKTLLDNVISGELDGAHMLSGQPIAATIGIGTKAHIVTALTMDQNGNAITVSNAVWSQMQSYDPGLRSQTPSHPISADALKAVSAKMLAEGNKLQMAMVFPVSTHNFQLRYWLAAAGIHPGMYSDADTGGRIDAEVELSVTPPPMMPATLEAGNIHGYCVGEPWNQQAVTKGIGVPVVTNSEIWKNCPEKVFGVTREWADRNPDTHVAVIKALIRAGQWLDATDGAGTFLNREEASRILSRPDYVGADFHVIKSSMTGHFIFQESDKRAMPDFNVFFRNHCTYPWYSDGIWFLTQMRRWGQISETKPAEWYDTTVRRIYLPEVYRTAAAHLMAEGLLMPEDIPPQETDGFKPPTSEFIDGVAFDGRDPIAYLQSHRIGNQD